MLGRTVAALRPVGVRTMAKKASDPIQKLFLDHLAKASKNVYKAGASDVRLFSLFAAKRPALDSVWQEKLASKK
jgi:hypothetical protein